MATTSTSRTPLGSHSDVSGTPMRRSEAEGPRPNSVRRDEHRPHHSENSWANVNWSTTYSSDEDSQSAASSQCLFPDHLGEEEEDVEMRTEDTPPSSPSTVNDEIDFLVPPPFVDPVAPVPLFGPSHTPPPVPQRTRRRTYSQSHPHAAADAAPPIAPLSRDVIAAPASAGAGGMVLLARPSARRLPMVLPSARSLWVTVALVTTVLMFGGIHPTNYDRNPAAELGGLLSTSASETGRTSSGIRATNPFGAVPPTSLRGGQQRSAFMYAVAARDAPRTFRMRDPGGDTRAKASDSFLLHGLYFTTLLCIVLWSARELRREVQLRRVGQDSIRDAV